MLGMVAHVFSPISQESEASRPLLNLRSVWAMQQVPNQPGLHSETLGPQILLPPNAMGTYLLNSPASQEAERGVCQPHLTSHPEYRSPISAPVTCPASSTKPRASCLVPLQRDVKAG